MLSVPSSGASALQALPLCCALPQEQEPQARAMAESLAPDANLSYALGGTLKYELPKHQVCSQKYMGSPGASCAQAQSLGGQGQESDFNRPSTRCTLA